MKVLFIVILLIGTTHEARGSEGDPAFAENEPIRGAPRFTVPDTLVVRSGSFSLRWTSPEFPASPRFELQQAMNRDFSSTRIIYAGPDQRTYISGLQNGDYFYRIRAMDAQQSHKGRWSPPIHRRVKHPSLGFVLGLMGVGATVFFSTIGVIATGIYEKRNG